MSRSGGRSELEQQQAAANAERPSGGHESRSDWRRSARNSFVNCIANLNREQPKQRFWGASRPHGSGDGARPGIPVGYRLDTAVP